MKKILYLPLFILVLLLLGCGEKNDSTKNTDNTAQTSKEQDQTKNNDAQSDTSSDDSLSTDQDNSEDNVESDETTSVSNKDVEVTAEYSYPNGIGDTYYYLVVKNNSNKTIKIDSSAIAYNKKGEEIGAADGSFEDLPSGCEGLVEHYFESTKNIHKFKYELEINEEDTYSPAIQDISVNTKKVSNKIIVKCKNNGKDDIEFLKATVLFFKGKKIVDEESSYFTNDDSVIVAGKQITKQLESYEKFDNFKVYLSGRKE